MDFPIKKQEIPSKHSDEDRAVAMRFSAAIAKELDKLCRAIVLFGSVTKHEKLQKAQPDLTGDIDVCIVLDDVTIQLTDEIMMTYRIMVENVIRKTSTRIHVTTLTLSTYWEYMRVADPVLLNILRSGHILLDSGIIEPMQILLRQGRIKPSKEAVWAYYLRAPQTLQNSQWHIMQAALDLYWAVIDAAHAALMAADVTPPSPKEAAELLRHTYVNKGLLEEHYVKTMEQFYTLSKDIMHRRIATMSAEYYDELYGRAKEFVDRMKSFLPTDEPNL